jgi:hypothetical protein
MKKIFFLLLSLMITTNISAYWRGGYGWGWGYPYYGYGYGYPYGGYGWGIGTGFALGAALGGGYPQDPVAVEEAAAMRQERRERERIARDKRKAERDKRYAKPKRTKPQIDAEIRQLQEERKSAAAA